METRANGHKITELEEKVLLQYIIDMDDRGFAPKLSGVEDMANYILQSRGAKKVGKLWAHRFVKHHTELKTRFNRVYDFQRALCEDPKLIERWFQMVLLVREGYGRRSTHRLYRSSFKAVYQQSITSQNIKAGFRGTGLIPFNPEAVLSKLDIRIHTPTPPPLNIDPWISQTPHNPIEALSQSTLVKSRISRHQSSSPTPIFETVLALAKGTERLAHENTLLSAENRTLRKANEALSKRRCAKKIQLRQGGVLTGQEALDILSQQEVDIQIQRDEHQKRGNSNGEASSSRCCSTCGRTGHNSRTCQNSIIDPRLLDS
ncbi:hypothetical protein SS1G_12406 [Sclerotinia sclerotiorum 1980 UF-70]|uniref:HTH CENPB-type domain-containing protein n=1 Tax=Sclerotinia sclerotiorum (strain ATCC 18683 / 1980 / Ss-1) TaxID=665079 RepID=A7F484_SCLS1|nr:hypothetical protein SS1G_12406 [Sclerotinia sclerotiorum 1980 UF-70]EDN97555.1 hypothetical protein SS1G_12406 [Sclerotinia sclerotiorum 1980 UF-70]